MSDPLPSSARVVVVGGGVIGCALAYHLTRAGASDVVLLERGRLTCGTSWHAAGLIMQLRSTHSLTGLVAGNVRFYDELEAETGRAIGFKRNGTLALARNEDRLHELGRLAGIAAGCGVEARMLSPAEAKALYPALEERRVRGALLVPGDGQLDPVDTTMALAAGARQRGARIHEDTEVTGLERIAGGGYRVDTARGALECETLALCAGLWTGALAARLGVLVPLHACEHMYVVTEPLDWVTPDLPVLRDTDGYVYVKEEAGKLLVGSFEPRGKPLPLERLPAEPAFVELPEDWDHFALPYGRAVEMLPALEHAGIARFMNGPESFTPDALLALGEAPGAPRCFVAAGLNSEGFEVAPGMTRALARWIVDGEPDVDLSDVDVARFHPFQAGRHYRAERAAESLGAIYQMHWPDRQRESARPIRKSPLHDRLAARGACFGETLGWERALWFAPAGTQPRNRYSYRRPNWFEPVGAEHRAVREGVAVFDVSSFGKLLVQGRDACAALQRLCANDVDVAPGTVVYTPLLNRRGGIEADVTVNRLDRDRFLVISSAAAQPRDRAWIERHLEREWGDAHVFTTDVTSGFAALSIQGPLAGELLGRASDGDLRPDELAYGRSREVEIGYARPLATRLSFVGELGFELLVPAEQATGVYDRILAAGEALGLVHAGYLAMESLRLESGYREQGLELTPDDTPDEAGIGFAVRLDKPGGFIGREALAERRRRPRERRLVLFRLLDPEPLLHGEEPILRDGERAGYLRSGAYGYTLGAAVGMGYLEHPDGITSEHLARGRFEIEIAGTRHPAAASLRPFLARGTGAGRGAGRPAPRPAR